jgi:hypothetical protein
MAKRKIVFISVICSLVVLNICFIQFNKASKKQVEQKTKVVASIQEEKKNGGIEKEKEKVEIKEIKQMTDLELQDYFAKFADHLNKKDLGAAYEMMDKDFLSDFNINQNTFNAKYESKFEKNFNIEKIEREKGKTFLSIILFDMSAEPNPIKKTFTVFENKTNISMADTKIENREDLKKEYDDKDISVSLSICTKTNEGIFLRLKIKNKSDKEIIVSKIDAMKGLRINTHKLVNGIFSDYTLPSTAQQEYLVEYPFLNSFA